MTYTLGIDLHKKSSEWILIDKGRNKIWNSSVPSHPAYISKAIDKIPVSCKDIQVAIEPVAGWRWVTKQLEDSEMDVHIANPRKIRLIATSDQKTDKNDSLMLAELLRSGYFPESHRVDDEIYEIRTMMREREHVIRMRTSLKNRIHGIATTQGLHLIPGMNPLRKSGRVSIMQSDNMALKEIFNLIDDVNHRLEVFDQYIAKTLKSQPVAKLLNTMPGVGPITSLTVLAEVGDFLRFPSASHLTSFAGLVPRQRSSGGKERLGHISCNGSRYLRSAVVEAAMRIREKGAPELYSFVARLKPNCGAKRSRVALARKMLSIMWYMVKNNSVYSADIVKKNMKVSANSSQHSLERS